MNKKEYLDYLKRWRAEHPNYHREWKAKHPDYFPKWRNKNKGWLRRWIENNPERWKHLTSLRKERLKAMEGSFTNKEWEELKKEYHYTCPSCKRREPEIKLYKDHIVPVVKNGTDYIENIQPLCTSCNSKKSINIIKFNKHVLGKS